MIGYCQLHDKGCSLHFTMKEAKEYARNHSDCKEEPYKCPLSRSESLIIQVNGHFRSFSDIPVRIWEE